MSVKLKRAVLYRGRLYAAGEPIPASLEMVEAWRANNLILSADPVDLQEAEPTNPPDSDPDDLPQAEPTDPPEAELLTAPGAPGLVEGGSGAEGEMPGRDSRQKRRK